ncbi:M56 family metallopeptidase [Longimicrobium sp.]|uniref:M56 family metallopeptidase n=1 Tax=Longimicrobium sp. TaxID=2029185 RepID=UPI003B3B07B0
MISAAIVPGAEWLPFLAQLALKATLILAVTAMVAAALWRSSAAVRHLVWCVGVAGVLALPLFSAVLPAWDVAMLPADAPAAPSISTPPVEAFAATPFAAETPDAPTVSTAVPSEARWAWVPRTAVAVAAAGVLAGLLWLALGFWGVARLGRRAQVVRDPEWLRTATDAADRLGLRRPVLLLRARGAVMPATGGLLWPSVVLPDSADQWSADRRHAVLAHELAHVKRFDTLTQALAQVACVLFWWHPAVWYAARRLRVERERACDDLVLGSGTRASDYAGHLLELARTHKGSRLANAALVSMARPSQLESRLLWVLDGARTRAVPSARATLLTVAAALLIVGPLAAMRPVALTGTGGPAPTGLAAALLADPEQGGDAHDRKADENEEAEDRAIDRVADVSLDAQDSIIDAAMDGVRDTPGDRIRDGARARARRDTIPTVEQLVAMRAVGVDAAYIAELRQAGYTGLTPDQLISMRAVGVSARYAQEMDDAGFGRLDAETLAGLRAVGVTPAYLAELRRYGYTDLDAETATGMRAVGVNAEYLDALRALGFTSIPAETVQGMKAVGVNAAYIQQIREAGYPRLSAETLTSFRAVGVTPEYVRQLERMGFRNLSADDVQSMRALNVTADYVAQMRGAGLDRLDAETLAGLRGVGVTPAYIRELAEVGLNGLTTRQLIELKGAGVTAAYVRELDAAGFRRLSVQELVRLRHSGLTRELIRSRTRESTNR